MERNLSSIGLHVTSSLKKKSDQTKKHQNDHSEPEKQPHHLEKDDDDMSPPSFNLQNVSKLILPPLGVSSYNHNPVVSKGWIISPMDSRYR